MFKNTGRGYGSEAKVAHLFALVLPVYRCCTGIGSIFRHISRAPGNGPGAPPFSTPPLGFAGDAAARPRTIANFNRIHFPIQLAQYRAWHYHAFL
jgi:hypothetical protein